ncbi:hypothetical protein OW763_05955 [Clostridium aestuarii]|uniref:Uncharacterized protein n=1 Tax=Clostridium aestuarii TaxID=338193 RepID=A0ABT4D0K4_9CLOT|nr:hypothetical protein [Clostridium aestuarii]MCY6483890.1 hypothetical protein [Clostridium aestuarii]
MDTATTEAQLICSSEINNWRKLSKINIILLLSYYIILFVIGLILSIVIIIFDNSAPEHIWSFFIINEENKINYFNLALIGSLSTSILGSSVFYIRKVYKLCIGNKITIPNKGNINDNIQNIGMLFYFVCRPLFSLAFAFLTILGLKAGMISITKGTLEVNNGFPSICMFITFFTGFSCGEFLSSLEKKSSSVISTLMKTPTDPTN